MTTDSGLKSSAPWLIQSSGPLAERIPSCSNAGFANNATIACLDAVAHSLAMHIKTHVIQSWSGSGHKRLNAAAEITLDNCETSRLRIQTHWTFRIQLG